MISGVGGVSGAGLQSLGANRAAATGSGGFGEMLSGVLESVSDAERHADGLVTALASGEDVQVINQPVSINGKRRYTAAMYFSLKPRESEPAACSV